MKIFNIINFIPLIGVIYAVLTDYKHWITWRFILYQSIMGGLTATFLLKFMLE